MAYCIFIFFIYCFGNIQSCVIDRVNCSWFCQTAPLMHMTCTSFWSWLPASSFSEMNSQLLIVQGEHCNFNHFFISNQWSQKSDQKQFLRQIHLLFLGFLLHACTTYARSMRGWTLSLRSHGSVRLSFWKQLSFQGPNCVFPKYIWNPLRFHGQRVWHDFGMFWDVDSLCIVSAASWQLKPLPEMVFVSIWSISNNTLSNIPWSVIWPKWNWGVLHVLLKVDEETDPLSNRKKACHKFVTRPPRKTCRQRIN